MTADEHDLDDCGDRGLYDSEYPHRQAHDDPDASDILYSDLEASETLTTMLAAAVLLVAVLMVVAAAGGIL